MSRRQLLAHHPEGVSLATFSRQTGIRVGQLAHYCRLGRIEGAQFDRVLWQWRIHSPAKLLLTGRLESGSQRAAPPSGAGVMATCGHAGTNPTQSAKGPAALFLADSKPPRRGAQWVWGWVGRLNMERLARQSTARSGASTERMPCQPWGGSPYEPPP